MAEYRIRRVTYPSGIWYAADRKILGVWFSLAFFTEDDYGCSYYVDTDLNRLIEKLDPDKFTCTSEVVWPSSLPTER